MNSSLRIKRPLEEMDLPPSKSAKTSCFPYPGLQRMLTSQGQSIQAMDHYLYKYNLLVYEALYHIAKNQLWNETLQGCGGCCPLTSCPSCKESPQNTQSSPHYSRNPQPGWQWWKCPNIMEGPLHIAINHRPVNPYLALDIPLMFEYRNMTLGQL